MGKISGAWACRADVIPRGKVMEIAIRRRPRLRVVLGLRLRAPLAYFHGRGLWSNCSGCRKHGARGSAKRTRTYAWKIMLITQENNAHRISRALSTFELNIGTCSLWFHMWYPSGTCAMMHSPSNGHVCVYTIFVNMCTSRIYVGDSCWLHISTIGAIAIAKLRDPFWSCVRYLCSLVVWHQQ